MVIVFLIKSNLLYCPIIAVVRRKILKWTTLSTVRLVDRPWVGVREDLVRFENGKEQEITVVENKVGVHVLPILGREKIVLIDKTFYPGGLESSLELPGGMYREGSFLTEALRELAEETRLYPAWCRYLFTLHKGPFRLANPSHVYLATGLNQITWAVDEDPNELINAVVTISLAEAVKEVGGRIMDAATAAAVLWLANERNKKRWASIF